LLLRIDHAMNLKMNTLIETLAKQAGMVEYPTGLGISENTIWGDSNIQKFALLIVKECIEVCRAQATYDPIVLPYKPSEQFMTAIKKHFGVVE
jgi:hypothetical protein